MCWGGHPRHEGSSNASRASKARPWARDTTKYATRRDQSDWLVYTGTKTDERRPGTLKGKLLLLWLLLLLLFELRLQENNPGEK